MEEIIHLMVEIGLSDLPKLGGGHDPLAPCSNSTVDAKFVLGQEMKSALHKRFFKAFLAHFLTCFLPTTHEFLYSGVQKLCFIKDSKAYIQFYYR